MKGDLNPYVKALKQPVTMRLDKATPEHRTEPRPRITNRWLGRIGWLALCAATATGADYALRDGDTVVFLGDSLTAARTYGKIIENYTLLRFPDRRIRFYNAGLGGDTAAGGLARLERDVLAHGATVVTVAYGMNDIGWGALADAAHERTYLDSIRGIIERCRAGQARVYICSAAVTAQAPAAAESGFLQQMCDKGLALARELGAQTIDLQRRMRPVQQTVLAYAERSKENVSLHLADGVHLSDLGQLAMAWVILKGLDAPAEVSAAHLDYAGPQVRAALGCRLTEVAVRDGILSFTRLDAGLPFNAGLFYALNFRFVPVPDDLNRYLLRIDNLPAGRYRVCADGLGVGLYTAQQLAAGVNIASATTNVWEPGGPWSAQAEVLQSLTNGRHEVAAAALLARLHYGAALADPLASSAEEADRQLIALQRQAARPRPYRFTVQPLDNTTKAP
jgi:lysophospholipase L1-like esterase